MGGRGQCLSCPCRAQGPAHSRQKLVGAEGLHDVILGTQVESPDDVLLLVAHRDHDDRDRLQDRIPLQLSKYLEPIVVGHDEVAENQVGSVAASEIETFAAIDGRQDVKALVSEKVGKESEGDRVIIDHQYACRPLCQGTDPPFRRQDYLDYSDHRNNHVRR